MRLAGRRSSISGEPILDQEAEVPNQAPEDSQNPPRIASGMFSTSSERGRRAPAVTLVACFLPLLPVTAALASGDEGEIWTRVSFTGALFSGGESGRWRYSLVAEHRSGFSGTLGTERHLLAIVGLDLSPDLRLSTGYSRVFSRHSREFLQKEHRLWQQAEWRPALCGAGDCSLRVRLESRNFSGGIDTRYRLRFRLGYRSPAQSLGRASWFTYLEPFVNVSPSRTNSSTAIAQTRLTLGVELPLHARSALQFGYLNKVAWSGTVPSTDAHVAFVFFKIG